MLGGMTIINPFDYHEADGGPRLGAPLGMLLTAYAQVEPDRPALTADGVTLTRAELEAAANRRARQLQLPALVVARWEMTARFSSRALSSSGSTAWPPGNGAARSSRETPRFATPGSVREDAGNGAQKLDPSRVVRTEDGRRP